MSGSGQNNNVPFKHISAVTLAVRDMPSAVDFYEKLGMGVTYGGGTSGFTTMRSGDVVLNLILSDDQRQAWWGRVILRVEDVDGVYAQLKAEGLAPERPQDADWGERFFHICDPDGHELSFAELLEESG